MTGFRDSSNKAYDTVSVFLSRTLDVCAKREDGEHMASSCPTKSEVLALIQTLNSD